MSMHKQNDRPELVKALADHGLPSDTPSQLADAFRQGWAYRERLHRAALDTSRDEALEEAAILIEPRGKPPAAPVTSNVEISERSSWYTQRVAAQAIRALKSPATSAQKG